MAGSENYVCMLSKASLKKAKTELNESPEDRLDAVKTLRDWIQEQPHIKFPTDTRTLLQYLRKARFSQVGARYLVEENLKMRKDFPGWFNNIDTTEEGLLSLLEAGFTVPLPKKDPQGRTVVLFKPGTLDPKKKLHDFETERRFGLAMQLYVGKEESTSVDGQVYILDLTGFSSKHLSRLTSDTGRKSHNVWQCATPLHMNSCNFINAGSYFDPLFTFMRPFTKKEFADNTKNHSSLEGIYKLVGMEVLPEEYLPNDYDGPHSPPVTTLIEKMVKEFKKPEFNAFVREMTSDKYCIDESLRPKSEPLQHFRKLNVD